LSLFLRAGEQHRLEGLLAARAIVGSVNTIDVM
jgi:hypothetical protein